MEFDTRRLIIKKFIPEYINVMFELWGNNENVAKYLIDYRYDWDMDEYKESILREYQDNKNNMLVVLDKESNNVVGNVKLHEEDFGTSVEIWIKDTEWNKGYGYELLKGIIKYAKKNKISVLYASVNSNNIGGKTILDKCEFELLDTIKDALEDNDGVVGDELLYEFDLD